MAPAQVPSAADPLLEVRDLTVRSADVTVVQDVSFTVGVREIVGLVGESGSGKSVTGLALMGLLPAGLASVAGSARLAGTDLLTSDRRQLAALRGEQVAMIFQDPLSALDPVFTIGRQIAETLRAHRRISRANARKRAIELLDAVRIAHAADRVDDYPHQLSGGMRQRVMIAITLACEPQLIIADEPTSALDVTIQAQILDLLRDISAEHDTSVLLVSHDLGVVAEVCSRVLTMYAGEIVETATTDDLLEDPRHPYSSGLLEAIPRAGVPGSRLTSIPGHVPSPDRMPAGCRFHPRCAHVRDVCRDQHPGLDEHAGRRLVRCVRADEILVNRARTV